MSVISQLQKRRNFAVEINGEPVRIRPLSVSEAEAMAECTNDVERLFYAIGKSLTEEDGRPTFEATAGESTGDFAQRVKLSLPDMPQHVVGELSEAIVKITQSPKSMEKIAGNSEGTIAPAS